MKRNLVRQSPEGRIRRNVLGRAFRGAVGAIGAFRGRRDGDGPSPGNEAEAVAFLGRIGPALHRFGAAAPGLESALERAAARFGVRGEFFSTPTAFFASFESEDDGPPMTYLSRIQPGDVDLERLAELDELMQSVVAGRTSAREGRVRLREIVGRPARYRAPWVLAAHVVATAGAALFLGGGLAEVLVAAGLGGVLGAMALLSARVSVLGRVFEPAAAFIAAFGAGVAAHTFGNVSPYLATVGGLIVLVPGLTVTLALSEISSRHLVSGTARLTGALGLFFTIGFGVALGTRAVEMMLGPVPASVPGTLPPVTLAFGLLAAPAAFLVLFRAPPREFPGIVVAAAIAYGGARLGSLALGPELGVVVGAMGVGLAGNLNANLRGRPSAVLTVPGLMILVPGSIGFESLSLLLARDVVTGMEAAFRMALVGTALATGLLLANVILPPRRGL